MRVRRNSLEEIAERLDFVSSTSAKLIGDIEGKLSEIEEEQLILANHYSTLANRVDYLEKKAFRK